MGFFSELWNKLTGGSASQSEGVSAQAPMNTAAETPAINTANQTPAEEGVNPVENVPAGANLGASEPQDDSSSAVSPVSPEGSRGGPNAPAEQPSPEEAKDQLQTDISGTREPQVGEMPDVLNDENSKQQ